MCSVLRVVVSALVRRERASAMSPNASRAQPRGRRGLSPAGPDAAEEAFEYGRDGVVAFGLFRLACHGFSPAQCSPRGARLYQFFLSNLPS